MEFLDKIGGVIFGVKRPETKETKWNYTYFREYMLALTRGKNFLLTSEQYPNRIELSKDWHQLLNNTRSQTSKNNIERYALIGFKEDGRLYLPTISEQGWLPSAPVPPAVIERQILQAKHNFGITGIVGDIHSHPVVGEPGFSAGDFYHMLAEGGELSPWNGLMLMGLVHGEWNLFALRTQKTRGIKGGHTKESFDDYYYLRYLRGKGGAWRVNAEIAKDYSLVLYKGQANQDLVKV